MVRQSLQNSQGNGRRKVALWENGEKPCSRVRSLFFLIFLMVGAIVLRLFFLQIANHNYYKDLAENQHSVFEDLIPKRGEIFLKEGQELYPAAVNKNTKMAFAVPREIKDPSAQAKILSEKLGLDEGDLLSRLSNKDDMYEVIKHKLNEQEIAELNNLKLEGIHLSEESFRYYPSSELASQVLGFVGWREENFGGRYGVENYFESQLAGEAGRLFQNKDNAGSWISIGNKELSQAKNGDSLVLTIDHIMQYETEKILKSVVKKFSAEKGSMIVMEVPTGKILALAGYPNFNPNDYKSGAMDSFRNLAVSDPYECGSVFKPITLAAAADAGKMNKDTTYNDSGQVVEAGYVIKNSDLKANGVQTMTQVLEKSLNTGAIYAEKLLGNENFSDYVKRFGFGEVTGIELPGESAGSTLNLKNPKRTINFFTASFGQGITVTPIQLVSAFNSIANGGMLMKPQIVEKIIRNDGSEEILAPQEVRKVISKDTADQMAIMLQSVVKSGHGKLAGVPGYLVGGKTGTAQVASSDARGYSEGKHIGSFVGFAPIDNPRFTVLVRIDNPQGVEWAESSAAPAFGELMKFLLNYKNIEPTEQYTQADLDSFARTHTFNEYFIKIKDEEEDKKDEETKKNDQPDKQ